MSVDNVDHDVAGDKAHTQETSVESGTGGNDLSAYSANRLDELRALAGANNFTNQSSYTLSSGVVDKTSDPHNISFENAEKVNTRDTGPEAGSGGDDLSAWSAGRLAKLRALAGACNFTNQSGYTLSSALVDRTSDPHDISFENAEKANTRETGTEAGSGGDDLSAWSADRPAELRALAGASNFQNNSSYTLSKGLVDRTSDPHDISFENGEKVNTEETDAAAGAGGNVLSVFVKSREEILRQIVGGSGSYTNNSSYLMPAGIVDSTAGGHDASLENGEKHHGVSAVGAIQTAEGEPMPGTATLEDDGTILDEVDADGQFVLSARPPNSIELGSNAETNTFEARFTIDLQGLDTFQDGIGAGGFDFGLVKYGAIEGNVTDFNGNPVPNESVEGEGSGASTDSEGYYNFQAPGGTEVSLTSLGGALTKTETPTGGSVTEVNWQFSGVLVSATLPDGTAIANAPIEIDTREGKVRTDEGGEYQYALVPPKTEVEVEYLESVTRSFTTNRGGVNYINEVELGAGVKGTVESTRGNPVGGVEVAIDAQGVPVSYTKESGEFSIGILDPGTITVLVADGDRRYERGDKSLTLADGDVREFTFTLRDKTNTPTY